MMKYVVLVFCILSMTYGCATTSWQIDPATKQVEVDTMTLLKSVQGFTLVWEETAEGHPKLTVKLEKSSTEAQIIDSFAPVIRELAPMAEALARMKAAQ